jgi:site-specific DNA recombinase
MDPAEGAVVQELFVRYVDDGATLGRVVAALEQQGIPTPHGRQHWSRSTLRWMLLWSIWGKSMPTGHTPVLRASAIRP